MNVIERRKNRKKPEIMSSDRMIKVSGYIPHKQRIEALMNAGARLREYRDEQYDVPADSEEEPEIDPTRNTGYDLADAFQQGRAVRKSLARQAKEREKEIEESKKREEELKSKKNEAPE